MTITQPVYRYIVEKASWYDQPYRDAMIAAALSAAARCDGCIGCIDTIFEAQQ